METDSGQRVTVRRREGARGRRERRLRAEARIRLQLCRDAVRIASHRGGEGYKTREGEVREQHYGPRAQERPLPGTRPAPLLEVLPQVGAQRHAVDQIVDVPGLPTLDGPVPLVVEQRVDVLQILDALIPVAEQVIDVPKFFVERIPPRTSVREPQLAEQLVEAPTIISYSSLREIVEQNVDIPVPHGRDGGEGLLGLHPGQSSKAFSEADFLPAATAEQIVDIPAARGGRVLHPASSSSGLPSTANQVVFPQVKKVRRLLRTRGRNCSPSRAHPRGLLSWRTPLSGCSSETATLASLTTGADALERLPGSHRLASRWCGSAKGMRRDWSGTGTGTRASLRLSSLLFLLGEELYRQPRAVYKY